MVKLTLFKTKKTVLSVFKNNSLLFNKAVENTVYILYIVF